MTAKEVPGHHGAKTGFQHYLVLLVLFSAFTFGFYQFVMPKAIEVMVAALFSPEGKKLPRIDGVLAEKASETAQYTGKLKGVIKTDYIFDFTNRHRTVENDGYVKESNEWIVKAPKLGEEAIVLEPAFAISILAAVMGAGISMLLTLILPSGIGLMANKVDREIIHTKSKIRLQTGFSDQIVDFLTMQDSKLRMMSEDVDKRKSVIAAFKTVWARTEQDEEYGISRRLTLSEILDDNTDLVEFRREVIYLRIKEFFSDFVQKEIEDVIAAQKYSNNHLMFMKGLRLYMSHHFTEKYSNNVTGAAYGGAAILIVIIGVRGLKFIPSTRPSLILGAIFLEGSMLALLAFSLVYTQEEERMDKMLKKMEDANRSQLGTLEDVSKDMHTLANALVEGNAEMIKAKVKTAVSDYLANPANIRGELAEEIANKLGELFAQMGSAQKSKS